MHSYRYAVAVCATMLLLAIGNQSSAIEWRVINLTGRVITNATGDCLKYQGLRDTIIRGGTIGPCGGHGILLEDSYNVVIERVTIRNTQESGIYIDSVASVEVRENKITSTYSAIQAIHSSSVRVHCNTLIDSRGRGGQHVQFNRVTGASNWCKCNIGRNTAGRTDPEDSISMYKSSGTATSPIDISNNLIVGGGPSRSGGGIMLGDDGGGYITARSNILVDPGQYGIAVAGGHHMSIIGNRIFARRQAFTNVGIYTWNQTTGPCNTIKVQGNAVNWTSSNGKKNPYWNGRNCGTIQGISSNNFNASFGAEIQLIKAPECKCVLAGRLP